MYILLSGIWLKNIILNKLMGQNATSIYGRKKGIDTSILLLESPLKQITTDKAQQLLKLTSAKEVADSLEGLLE